MSGSCGHPQGRPTLRIYVALGCAGCRTALRIADAVRQARPEHPVEVIDLADHPDASPPSGVIGTPTYLLGADVVSLGNPDLTELLHRLDSSAVTGNDD